MNNELEQLKRDIEELKRWKEERTRQQITFPLDKTSQEAIGKYFMYLTQTIVLTSGVGGGATVDYIGKQDDKEFLVQRNNRYPYTVDPSTDYLTLEKGAFYDNDRVYIYTEDTEPSPLAPSVGYYVRDSNGKTFKLATTSGGTAINITNVGVGKQFIGPY
jgi:hypothetical protein